jgi:hypothetical protein
MLSGTLPVPGGFTVAGSRVAVDISGISRLFQLDSRGHSLGVFSLQAKTGRFKLQLMHGDFRATLAKAGLTNSDVRNKPVTVTVTIVFNGGVFQAQEAQLYSAHLNHNGKTK